MSNNSKNTSEKKLSILVEDLENYFANTIIPQLFVDADFVLRKFTPPAMKQFSLSEKDLNRDIRDVTENIKYPTLIENITEVMATKEILKKEIQTTDGRWFQMNILPYIVRKENRINGVIITFVDINQRIASLKELEKLNAQHETLIYALAHDIRQPLSSIVLLVDGLKEAYNRQNKNQFEKWIATLQRSSNTMKSLLNDFTNQNMLEPVTVEERLNIENIYENTILALWDEIHSSGIKLTTDFKTSEIIFSRNNVRSILYNLLNNAIKFKRPKEPLKISITSEKLKGFVRLSVKDNGIGISEYNLEKIFKKSQRLNDNIEGTGMGLYIMKRMLLNNGGKIEVDSKLGEGSTFHVYFKSEYEGEK